MCGHGKWIVGICHEEDKLPKSGMQNNESGMDNDAEFRYTALMSRLASFSRRVFSWENRLLTAFLVLFSRMVSADPLTQTAMVDGVKWSYLVADGVATIVSEKTAGTSFLHEAAIPTSTVGRVVVPATLGGAPVAHIGNGAFRACRLITEVEFPDTVVSIGDHSFDSCTNLVQAVLPDSLASLGSYAFSFCGKLEIIAIPDGMTAIPDAAFNQCGSLSSVAIPKTVTAIGEGAFAGCRSLAAFTIPGTVKSVGPWAFDRCTSLTNIAVEKGVQTIGNLAFHGTPIERITLPATLRGIGCFCFDDCESLRIVTFLGPVPKMGDPDDDTASPASQPFYAPYLHNVGEDGEVCEEKPKMFIDYPQTPENRRAAWFKAVGPQVIAENRLSDDLKAYVTNLVLQSASPRHRAAKACVAAAGDDGNDDPADPAPDITGFVTYATAETIALCRDFGILPERRVENHTAICDFAPPSVVIEGLDPATGTLDARVVPGTGPAFGNPNGFLASSADADVAGSVSVLTSPQLDVAMLPVDAAVDDDDYFSESAPGLLRCTLPMDGDTAFFRVSIAPTP